ncbi:hypothetical protein OG379_04535 [Streptomyces sp. NBC_01166]|uniref:hypothetical protein n=1 Tax=Streptomyces sp. NBC_01166 TaxID=2903755 RepID=UPI00386C3AD4|nr:hypothetical protein OG379_04535 [Streptomyces sp. NBC_01166]
MAHKGLASLGHRRANGPATVKSRAVFVGEAAVLVSEIDRPRSRCASCTFGLDALKEISVHGSMMIYCME